jgi:hypothetical protein
MAMKFKRDLKLLLAIFLLAYLIAPHVHATDPRLVVTIELGEVGKESAFHYQLKAANEKEVRFTLWLGKSVIEKGRFEYPHGFKGFVSDLWVGYAEASEKYDYGRRDKGGNDLIIYLGITFGSGLNTFSLMYRGSVDGFTRFARPSLNLERSLKALSSGRMPAYRLWSR